MSIRWTWLPAAESFAAEYGIPHEVVEAAAEQPTTVGLNAESGRDGYVIEDRRRGDVTAVVGYREKTPSILYVRVHTPDEDFARGSRGTSTAGAPSNPKTMRGVRARIIADGFTIVTGRNHDRVLAPDGATLCTLSSTPGAYTSAANTWSDYTRARDRWRAKQRVADGNLLEHLS